MQVPHGGGLRFTKTAPEYRILLNWLKDGAPLAADDARVESLTIQPQQLTLPVGGKVQLKVTAKWWDGRVEDITRKAVYASADEPVASVSPTGLVNGLRWGGTSIQIRFLGMARAVFLTLPQARKDNKPFPDVPRASLIDRYVFDNLKRMNVLPSGLTTDEQFCRRVYLDVIGVLPTPEELERFLAGKAPDRRAKLIDQLLERPEFVDLRTLRLADMLRLNPRKISGEAGFGDRAVILFTEWIRDSVAKNRPYNEFVYDLLAARGKIYFNGPADFWAIERAPNDRAEATAQGFLGVRMQCARCHKHPFDRWTTDDYWNFSAFMGKVGLSGGRIIDENVVHYAPGAQVTNMSVTGRNRGKVAPATYLGDKEPAPQTKDMIVSL